MNIKKLVARLSKKRKMKTKQLKSSSRQRQLKREENNRKTKAVVFGKKNNKLAMIKELFSGFTYGNHLASAGYATKTIHRKRKHNRNRLSVKAKFKRRQLNKAA